MMEKQRNGTIATYDSETINLREGEIIAPADKNPHTNYSLAVYKQMKDAWKQAMDPEMLKETSLALYIECLENISDGSESENAIETQAKMCRSLHMMQILEKQLVRTSKQCKLLVRYAQNDFSHQREEDVQVKLKLLNQLVRDLEVKQAIEEKYKVIIHKQEHMLREIEKKRQGPVEKSEHSRISVDQLELLSCTSDGVEEDLGQLTNSYGEQDDCRNFASEQRSKSLTLANRNCLAEDFNSSTDLDILNAISSDSSDLFCSDDGSDDEDGSFVSPEEADLSLPSPWRKTPRTIETSFNGEVKSRKKTLRRGDSMLWVKECAQSEPTALTGRSRSDRDRKPLLKHEPAGPTEELKIIDDNLMSPTTKFSETDISRPSEVKPVTEKAHRKPKSKNPSEVDTICSSDVSVVLEKAQLLADALKNTSKEGWEIDRKGGNQKSAPTSSAGPERPSLDRRLSSHSVLGVLEKQDWGAASARKPKRLERQSIPTLLPNQEGKSRPVLPRGLSSQGLLLHIEKHNWGSTKTKQADFYFQQLDKPAEFRLVSSKRLMRKNRLVKTAASRE